MQNFMKTILSGIQAWTRGEIRKSAADWNQSDPNTDNYIKNRTHWEENVKTVLVPEKTIEGFAVIEEPIYGVKNPFFIQLKLNQTYVVIWDGVTYNLPCYEIENGVALIGNANYFDMQSGGDIPFAIIFNNDNGMIFLETESTAESHTIFISTTETIIHKLDYKYLNLPSNLATTDDVENKMDSYEPRGQGSFHMNSRVLQHGSCSASLGMSNKASGNYSIALGQYTTTIEKSQMASGKFNIASSYKILETIYEYTQHSDPLLETKTVYISDSYTFDSTTGIFTLNNPQAILVSDLAANLSSYINYYANFYKTTNSYKLDVASSSNKNVFYKITFGSTYSSKNGYKSIPISAQYTLDPASIPLVTIGNGTSSSKLSNAHTLSLTGEGWYAGDVYVGSTSGVNKDEGSKKLATEEYVNINTQTKITGTPGQFVIIGDDGNAITKTIPNAAVTSVNGKKGDVTLSADDVGALPADTEIPEIPETLPNPHALTINGTSYDGSEEVSINTKELPEVTEDDNGKFLGVSGGVWEAQYPKVIDASILPGYQYVTNSYGIKQELIVIDIANPIYSKYICSGDAYTFIRIKNGDTIIESQHSLRTVNKYVELISISDSEIVLVATQPRGTANEFCYNYIDLSWSSTVTSYSASIINQQLAKKVTAPEVATVGQTIVVKAVDENGKPTEWECVDIAGGGEAGGYYTPAVSQPEAGSMEISFDASSGEMPEVAPVLVALPTGADGYTPVKGVDYFTADDKNELVQAVLAALPAAEEGSF